MFGRKKQPTIPYNPETMRPILRCSICNGEQVFGFKNLVTGEFVEVALIRYPGELEEYKKLYGIEKVDKEY